MALSVAFIVGHIHFIWDSYTLALPRIELAPDTVDAFFVNGEYQPIICMSAGAWIKFRFAQVETTELSRIFYIGDGECTLYLLARDGVIVHGEHDRDVPRLVGNWVWLAQSSRADVAVSCPGSAETGRAVYDIWHWNEESGQKQIIAQIKVSGTETQPQTSLTAFTPIRPAHLENLLDGHYFGDLPTQKYPSLHKNEPLLDYWQKMAVSGNAIGFPHTQFQNETNYLQFIEVDTINTWEVITFGGHNLHSLHVHVNHFQILNSSLPQLDPSLYVNWVDIPDGYQVRGDWLDTLWGPAWIRFKTDTFAGTIALHCHILIHEDQGSMGTVKITNGCDHDYSDYNGDGACNYRYTDSCEMDSETTTQDTSATKTSMAFLFSFLL